MVSLGTPSVFSAPGLSILRANPCAKRPDHFRSGRSRPSPTRALSGHTPARERYKGPTPYQRIGFMSHLRGDIHNNMIHQDTNMKVQCRHCGVEWIVNAWEEVLIIRELDPCHVGSQGIHSLRGCI